MCLVFIVFKCVTVSYNYFENFNEGNLCNDVSNISFHVSYVFDDIDDMYWAYATLLYVNSIYEWGPRKG